MQLALEREVLEVLWHLFVVRPASASVSPWMGLRSPFDIGLEETGDYSWMSDRARTISAKYSGTRGRISRWFSDILAKEFQDGILVLLVDLGPGQIA